MPIDLKRDNIDGKLSRLTYSKGLKIKRDVADFLSGHTKAFSADEIVARIDVAANAVMVESVLSSHDIFSYGEKDGTLYWYVKDENLEEALEVAEKRL